MQRIREVGVVWRSSAGVRPSVSLALVEGNPVSLGETVEGAAVDAEELGGKLLVPPGMPQHPADVSRDDFP